MNTYANLTFLTPTIEDLLPREWCCPEWVGFHTSNNIIKTTLQKCTQNTGSSQSSLRLTAQITVDCVRLTIKTNHYNHRQKFQIGGWEIILVELDKFFVMTEQELVITDIYGSFQKERQGTRRSGYCSFNFLVLIWYRVT